VQLEEDGKYQGCMCVRRDLSLHHSTDKETDDWKKTGFVCRLSCILTSLKQRVSSTLNSI